MFTVNDLEVDEPVTTEAFICELKDLEVTGCYLDDFIKVFYFKNIIFFLKKN